nr:MAG TPA: hypothetical protein [Caudoviricetes sp.]
MYANQFVKIAILSSGYILYVFVFQLILIRLELFCLNIWQYQNFVIPLYCQRGRAPAT